LREPIDHIDDQAMWHQMQQGQSQALAMIYDKYANVLYNYGKSFTTKSTIVEDAIQDLLTEVWTRRAQLTTPHSVKGYLIKSFRQKLLRLLTKEKQWQLVNDYSTFTLNNFQVPLAWEEANENQAFKQKLQQAISELSSRQQEAIILKYTENLTHQEIADIMDIKIQTLYNLLHTAIQKLSKTFQNEAHPVYTFLSFS